MEINLDEYFDYYGLSEFLKIPIGSLRHRVKKEKIPHFKIGRSIRFSKQQILLWVNEYKQEGNQTEIKEIGSELYPVSGDSE